MLNAIASTLDLWLSVFHYFFIWKIFLSFAFSDMKLNHNQTMENSFLIIFTSPMFQNLK